MFLRLHTTGATFAVTLGLAMLAPAALAQTAPANQQAPSGTPASRSDTGPAPNDTELKHFAHAAVAVQNIRQTMQPEIVAAKTADDRTKLKQTAEKKMEAAVRSNHLSIQRYVQIATVVQKDSTIRAKVESFMPPKSSTKS